MSATPISHSSQLDSLKNLIRQLEETESSIDFVEGTNESYVTDQKTTAITIRAYAKNTFTHLSNANQIASVVFQWKERELIVIYSGGTNKQISHCIESYLRDFSTNHRLEITTQENFRQKLFTTLDHSLSRNMFVQVKKT